MATRAYPRLCQRPPPRGHWSGGLLGARAARKFPRSLGTIVSAVSGLVPAPDPATSTALKLGPAGTEGRTAGPAGGRAIAHQSRPLVERLDRALVKRFKDSWAASCRKSLLGMAIDYALGQWSTLQVLSGRRPGRDRQQPGRKRHSPHAHWARRTGSLSAGSRTPANAAAIIYTLVESCRRRNQDPYSYLRDVLTRLPHMTNHQIREVTPAAWRKAQSEATPTRFINVRRIDL